MKLVRLLLSLVLVLGVSLFVSISNGLANYSPDFTVSNVQFNPATNHLEFDFSGAPFTDSQIFSFDLRNSDADTTHLWWRTTGGSTVVCSGNHCDGFLTSGGHDGQGRNASYPYPYPLESQEMVIEVSMVGTGIEYFSSSFTYGSTGGYTCITTNPSPTPTPGPIYSSNFTASNIVLNPSTYELSFDFSGAPFTDSQIASFDLRNIDAGTTGMWWRSTGGSTVTCSGNHCEGSLPLYNGSYSLYPPDSQDMVVEVSMVGTGAEYYSQSFKFGTIWQGGACFVPATTPTPTPTPTPTLTPTPTSTPTPTPIPVPTSIQSCQNGGWMNFANPSFQNQVQCIQYFNTH